MGFNKYKQFPDITKVKFLTIPWDSPLTAIVEFGTRTRVLLASKGVKTLYQLAGVFLTFKTCDEEEDVPISQQAWCDKMWLYLSSSVRSGSQRSRIIDALGEKLAIPFEGIYDVFDQGVIHDFTQAQQHSEQNPYKTKQTHSVHEEDFFICRHTVFTIVHKWHNHGDILTSLTLKKLYQNLHGKYKLLEDDNSEQKNDDYMCMAVEWAGSGKVLSYGFMLQKAEPIINLPHLLGTLLPPNPRYRSHLHRIFLGHGGKEITRSAGLLKTERGQTCGEVLAEDEVLVILPGLSTQSDSRVLSSRQFTSTWGHGDAFIAFLEASWDTPLIKVPIIGASTATKLNDRGIMTLYQLAGVFLTFKTLNKAGTQPISQHEWCQNMWDYLKALGTPGQSRTRLINCLGEKLALGFDGIYE